jgi:hypothetical protein
MHIFNKNKTYKYIMVKKQIILILIDHIVILINIIKLKLIIIFI